MFGEIDDFESFALGLMLGEYNGAARQMEVDDAERRRQKCLYAPDERVLELLDRLNKEGVLSDEKYTRERYRKLFGD